MEIRPLKDDDALPNEMKIEPSYLKRARDSGRYFPFVAVEGGRVWGFAEATLQFHPTRGTAMRVRFVYGPDKALRPFLATFCQYANRMNLCAVYLTSSPYHPELCTAARFAKFSRIEGDVAMRRGNERLDPFSVPDIRIRSMMPSEYLRIRNTILPLVSKGPYVSNQSEVSLHVESRLFFPMVAVSEAEQVVAYAELALGHAGLASCYVGRVERVVVDPLFRGRRIARLLVGELVRKGRDLGCEHVGLLVAKKNAAALKTYGGIGFVPTAEIPYWLDCSAG
ncbi:MAG: GNAT family N-acetyltransferase [Candidatus Uhrbacteria bacterium]